MKIKQLLILFSVAMSYPNSAHAGMVVDFEDAGPPRSTYSADSGGFIFSSPDIFLITEDRFDASSNGTLNLFNVGRGLLTMERKDGEVFDIFQADFGEGEQESPSNSIIVTGFFENGESIEQVLHFDGLPDFETISLESFINLDHVTFQAVGGIERFSIDNIVVPEPATLRLLFTGAFVIGKKQ